MQINNFIQGKTFRDGGFRRRMMTRLYAITIFITLLDKKLMNFYKFLIKIFGGLK